MAVRLLPTYALDTRFERTDISAVAVRVMLQQGSGFRLGLKGSGLQNPGLRQTLIEDDTPLEERLGLLRARIEKIIRTRMPARSRWRVGG
jgi:hypothetical protein